MRQFLPVILVLTLVVGGVLRSLFGRGPVPLPPEAWSALSDGYFPEQSLSA